MSEGCAWIGPSSAPGWARRALVCAVLYFPVCGLAILPLGGGGRYLSVLAGPLALGFLLVWHRREWRDFRAVAWRFTLPFLPWFTASLVVMTVYPRATIGDPFSRVLWALAIALAAMRARVSREAIFTAAAVGSLIYGAVAAYELLVLGAPRAGAATNPIIFAEAAMLTSGLALAGAYSLFTAPAALRVVWLMLGCAGVAAVVLSYSRGPLLGLFVLVLLLCVDGWRQGRKLTVSLAASGTMLVIGILLLLTPLGDRTLLAWTEASDYITRHATQSSIGARLELWRIALASIGECPWLGYGYNDIQELSRQISALDFMSPEMPEALHHFHNDWIHALMTGGLVLLLGLAATVIALACQARFDLPRLWLLGAMLIFGLTDLAFFRKPTVTLFIAAWALLFADRLGSEHATAAHPVHR